MNNKDLKFKSFCKNEDFSKAKIFTMEDVKNHPETIPRFDIALSFMCFQDANETDVYAGDILCLTITDELMNPSKNSFFNSNLGKYITKHPEVTEIYLAINQPDDPYSGPFRYTCYMARNHKIDRWDEDVDDIEYAGKLMENCTAEDTMFPKYLICKGAVIVANLYNDPEFLERL